MSPVLNLLLTHQPPAYIARLLAYWKDYSAAENLLIVFDGSDANFDAIAHPGKVRVDDPRLRTRDHVRERQSYTGVLKVAAEWLRGRPHGYVHFAEYDQPPLARDLNARQVARLEAEKADVLGFHLVRIDGTSQPPFLNHAYEPAFLDYWSKISVRADKGVVLSMLGTGSFWTRQAFDAVASRDEPLPMYLELYLPTLAHHLGYRVRDWGVEASRYISSSGNFMDRMEEARQAGAWTIHPVKTLPPLP
jgi:hypothetical protein